MQFVLFLFVFKIKKVKYFDFLLLVCVFVSVFNFCFCFEGARLNSFSQYHVGNWIAYVAGCLVTEMFHTPRLSLNWEGKYKNIKKKLPTETTPTTIIKAAKFIHNDTYGLAYYVTSQCSTSASLKCWKQQQERNTELQTYQAKHTISVRQSVSYLNTSRKQKKKKNHWLSRAF